MKIDNNDKIFTYETLAKYLVCSEYTLRTYVSNKTIPHFKLGKVSIRFRKRDIDSWLNKSKVGY